MDFLRPETLAEALELKAERPDAVPIAGGTDVMVELNFDHRRPSALLDLTRIPELRQWSDGLRVGSRRAVRADHRRTGRAIAGPRHGRTNGRVAADPQPRHGRRQSRRGLPAGDTHPVLLASDAVIEVASVRGTRMIPAAEFYLGVKRNALEQDELIVAVHLTPAKGPQQFSKVGTRNAMVIAVCSFGISLFPEENRVGAAVGSAAPTPRRAGEAEQFLASALDFRNPKPLLDSVKREFGELVSQAASPIDDVRGSAAYRKHALAVMARRTLGWAWQELLDGERACA